MTAECTRGVQQQGLCRDAEWHGFLWIIENVGRHQAIREAWGLFKNCIEKALTDFMDDQLVIADRGRVCILVCRPNSHCND